MLLDARHLLLALLGDCQLLGCVCVLQQERRWERLSIPHGDIKLPTESLWGQVRFLAYLSQELSMRVDELAVLLLQLGVADLGGTGLL